MKLTGIDDFSDDLDEIVARVGDAEQLGREDVLPDSWIESHTSYETLQEFVEAGFGDQYDTFDEIPGEEWDEWVDRETQFSDWEEMQKEAGQAWVQRQLGF